MANTLEHTLSLYERISPVVSATNGLLAAARGLRKRQAETGSLLALAMQGQTSALTQTGHAFTQAQEQALRYGTEEERVAALSAIVAGQAGGMNRALAATPEGGLRQHADTMTDLQERIGRLGASVQASLLPLFKAIGSALAGWFGRYRDSIAGLPGAMAEGCAALFMVAGTLAGLFGGWTTMLQQSAAPVSLLTTLLGSLADVVTLVTAGKAAWATVQSALNLSLLACPITWIAAGILALAAAVVCICSRVEGWGSLWEGIVGFMKYSFLAFVQGVKLHFTTLIDGILLGLDTLRLGWYRFREACGMGESADNRAAIAGIAADMEARKRAIAQGAQQVADNVRKARESLAAIDMSWKGGSQQPGEGGTDRTTALFGTRPAGIGSLTGDMAGTMAGSMAADAPAGPGTTGMQTTSAIAAAGAPGTPSVTIHVGSLVEQMIFEGGYEESREAMQSDLESALIRVLQMADSAQ